MQEREIERYLVMRIAQVGGKALKFVSPSYSGMPDRLLLLPDGKVAFVEVKAPRQTPRRLQEHRIAMLRQMGQQVFVVDTKRAVDDLVYFLTGERMCM